MSRPVATHLRAVVVAFAAGLVLTASVVQAAQSAPALSAKDRTDIQQLSARYAETLGACAAADYAALFGTDGYFASGFRGKIQGTEALIALVKSERHCSGGAARPNLPIPAMTLEPTAEGAVGKVTLAGNGGAYEDVYVKGADGWHFKSRTHFTVKELESRK